MKYILTIITIFFLVCVASCSSNKNKQVIPIQQMKVIIWDMMNAGEWNTLIVQKDSAAIKRKENIKLYEQVFAVHQVAREQFYNSYRFYEEHPDQLKILFDSVSAYGDRERLKAMKTAVP